MGKDQGNLTDLGKNRNPSMKGKFRKNTNSAKYVKDLTPKLLTKITTTKPPTNLTRFGATREEYKFSPKMTPRITKKEKPRRLAMNPP